MQLSRSIYILVFGYTYNDRRPSVHGDVIDKINATANGFISVRILTRMWDSIETECGIKIEEKKATNKIDHSSWLKCTDNIQSMVIYNH